MATQAPSPADTTDVYDVYISYARPDSDAARRLADELAKRGLRVFSDVRVPVGETWDRALEEALVGSRALVVVWSTATAESRGVLDELVRFDAVNREREDRPIIPVVIEPVDFDRAPDALAKRQAVILDEKPGEEDWARAADTIAAAVERRRAEEQSSEPADTHEPPEVSGSARRALMYASTMLGTGEVDPSRLRTAGLLGALYESLRGGMTPTTGDVVRLVLERQEARRGADEALAAAATAAGLHPISGGVTEPPPLDTVARSAVGELLRDAIAAHRQSSSDRVHLRHVLATGVHPAVPDEALGELGVTLDELRAAWRDSIARTWPQEAAGWEAILARGGEESPAAGAPPTARVHRDRWTVEDRLDYALYAKAIAEFISHRDAKPPMVISVQGPWGQGKTSLMRMIQRNLDPGHPDLVKADGASTPAPHHDEHASELTFGELRDALDGKGTDPDTKPRQIRSVWFNAWKYQSSEQIWAGLAHAILAQLPARLEPRDRELFWLRLQLRRIDPGAVREDIHKAALEKFLPMLAGRATFALGTLVVAGLAALAGGLEALGVGVAGAGVLTSAAAARSAWAKASQDALGRHLEGAYLRYVQQPDYAGKLGYLHLVEEDMTRALELLTPDEKPAVIFIDDLDRCSPAKIGEVIEGGEPVPRRRLPELRIRDRHRRRGRGGLDGGAARRHHQQARRPPRRTRLAVHGQVRTAAVRNAAAASRPSVESSPMRSCRLRSYGLLPAWERNAATRSEASRSHSG
jgi:TIR domain/KAP family P-loop domain